MLHDKYMPMMKKAIGRTVSTDQEITLSHAELIELLDFVYEEGKEAASDAAFEAGLNWDNPSV